MAIGREAARDQLAAVLLTATTAPHALAANLYRMERDDTPRDNLEAVLFSLTWADDDEWRPQGRSGNRRLSQFGLTLVLARFMPQAIVEKGAGQPGSLGDEEAENVIMRYWQTIRHRLGAEAHWSQGTTGIVDVRDLRTAGVRAVRENRLERRFRMTVIVDEDL